MKRFSLKSKMKCRRIIKRNANKQKAKRVIPITLKEYFLLNFMLKHKMDSVSRYRINKHKNDRLKN
jgi:hypothetical protein